MVAIKNLLQDYGQFEDGKHFIKFYLAEIASPLFLIAFEDFFARKPAWANLSPKSVSRGDAGAVCTQ